jgi:hypothetical protein
VKTIFDFAEAKKLSSREIVLFFKHFLEVVKKMFLNRTSSSVDSGLYVEQDILLGIWP